MEIRAAGNDPADLWENITPVDPAAFAADLPPVPVTAHQHMFTEPDVRDGGAAGELHGLRCACGTTWFPARGERAR